MIEEQNQEPEIENPNQLDLFGGTLKKDWEKEWVNMPNFVQKDLEPFKSVIVHFETRDDMNLFAELVKQKLNITTISIWYPAADIAKVVNKRWVKE